MLFDDHVAAREVNRLETAQRPAAIVEPQIGRAERRAVDDDVENELPLVRLILHSADADPVTDAAGVVLDVLVA